METYIWLIMTNTGNVRQAVKTKANAVKTLKRAGYRVGRFVNDYAPFYLLGGSGEVPTGFIVKTRLY